MSDYGTLNLCRLPLPLAAEIDRISDDFAAEWRAGGRPRAEDYLNRVGDDLRAPLLGELLRVELEARRAAGEEMTEQEFHDRFPDDQTAVEAAFQATQSLVSGQDRETGLERIGKYQVV